MKNNQLIILFNLHLINIIIFNFLIYNCLIKKKVVPKLRQEVKVKADIVSSDDNKIYYAGKFQDFTARYIINFLCCFSGNTGQLKTAGYACSRLSSDGGSLPKKLRSKKNFQF